MWCAALPCARDFDARLDGTAVVRVDRPLRDGTIRHPDPRYDIPSKQHLIYSTRFPFSFEPCSRFSFQMYHRSLIPDRATVETGPGSRCRSANQITTRRERRVGSRHRNGNLKSYMYRSRVAARQCTDAGGTRGAIVSDRSSQPSDQRRSTQRRCVYAGTRRTSCVPYDTPHSTYDQSSSSPIICSGEHCTCYDL
jgi:hypothetical protein